ncbi:hypothetical protein WMY93_004862 [Mugilogobius chulae]|uniref:Neural proliferation differentiation and control protein 1 n=1 Tax=Mugilogobius chulae TaxID=88201 RepID=A0AAW0PZI8_9GOBI
MVAGACWVRLQRGVRVDYGLLKPQTFHSLPADIRLVQNAQMFHFQHQRRQMLSLHRLRESPKALDSGASTDDENEDFTVYECPGLAPTGEMEVKNPLFDDSALHFHRLHNPPPFPKPSNDRAALKVRERTDGRQDRAEAELRPSL